jgi:uncharacterized protein YhaN
MHIKSVSLKGFGILKHYTLEFSREKLNIIVGNNETGKSTLCNAIVAIIYGLSGRGDSENRRAWDYSGEFRGAIEIDYGDASYRIERDFETNHVKMSRLLDSGENLIFEGDANPKGRTEQPRAYRKALDDLGFPPETIFRSAIYIAQLELDVVIDDELRKHLSGAGKADYLKVLNDLEKQYYSLTRQNLPGDNPKRTDKPLEEKIAQLQELAAQLQESRNLTIELVDTQDEFEKINQRSQYLTNRKAEIESEKKELDEFLHQLEARSSLDQRIKLVEEKNAQRESIEKTIDGLAEQLNGKFSIYKNLSDNSLRELETYVQSDGEKTLQEIQDIQRQEQQLTSELDSPQFNGFSDLPDDTLSILRRLDEERKNISELTKQLNDSGDHLKSRPPRWILILGLAFMSIIGFVLGGTAIFLLKNNLAIGIAAALILFAVISGFIAAILSISQNSRIQRVKERQVELQAQITEKQKHTTELSNQISALLGNADLKSIVFEAVEDKWAQYQQKRQALLALTDRRKVLAGRDILKSWSNPEIKPVLEASPARTIRQQLEEFRSIKSRLEINKENLQKMINTTDSANTLETLRSQYRDVVILIDQLEKNNPTLNSYRADRTAGLVQLKKLESETEQIYIEIGQTDQTNRGLEVRLGQYQVSAIVDPQLLEEQISDLQEAVSRLQERVAALRVAIEVLNEAIKEYQESHIARLSHLATESFSNFTHGGYKSLEIIPGKEPQIKTNKNRTIQLTQLSIGAKDQLFFALRLAISEILSNEISMPLILDDTFVNFDKTRLEAVRKTLDSISTSRQIILLSHDSGYMAWGSPPRVHSDK